MLSWTVPTDNLKGNLGTTTDFRCLLSEEAVKVVELAMKHSRGSNLFPALRGNSTVSDVGVSKVMKRAIPDAEDKPKKVGTVHGLRASFGAWAMSEGVPLEMSDRCLQHSVGSAVSRAYHRDDVLDQRRVILDDWASYATSERDKLHRARLMVV